MLRIFTFERFIWAQNIQFCAIACLMTGKECMLKLILPNVNEKDHVNRDVVLTVFTSPWSAGLIFFMERVINAIRKGRFESWFMN
jgi:hypothetical protein